MNSRTNANVNFFTLLALLVLAALSLAISA